MRVGGYRASRRDRGDVGLYRRVGTIFSAYLSRTGPRKLTDGVSD